MPLITVTATVARSHGGQTDPLPASGVIDWTPATHGVYGRSLRARDSVCARIVDGIMEPVTLTPGPWDVLIRPDDGIAWDAFMVDLDGTEPAVDLVDLAPVLTADGEKWARGRGVAGVRDLGGAFALTLTDGSETEPITIPGSSGTGPVEVASDGDGTWTLSTPTGSLPVTTDGDGTWQIGA